MANHAMLTIKISNNNSSKSITKSNSGNKIQMMRARKTRHLPPHQTRIIIKVMVKNLKAVKNVVVAVVAATRHAAAYVVHRAR